MATRAEIILAGKDATQAMFASVSRSVDGLTERFGRVKTGAVSLGAAITAGVAVLGAKSSIDMLDQLDDLQEKTGISVEKLSELRYAGESVGTPLEALAGGVGRLSKQIAEAAGGNKQAAETFRTLGIEVKNADGTVRSSEEVLGELADRFASYKDGTLKAALAQEIFGKSGAEMIPLLNQGREGIEKLRLEAEQLGAIYGGSLAKDAADFNDNLTKLRISGEAASVALGGPFLKSLVSITNQMLEAKKEGSLLNALLVTIGGGFARTLGMDEIGDAQKRAQTAMGEMARLRRQMDGVELTLQRDPGNEMAQRRMATYRGQLEEQQRVANAASEELKRLADKADPMGSAQRRKEDRGWKPESPDTRTEAPVIASPDKSSKGRDEEAKAKQYIESLAKQIEKVKELSQVEVTLAEIQRIRANGGLVSEDQKQAMLKTAAEIDVLKERAEAQKTATKDQEEAQRRLFAVQDEARRVFESSRTPLEAYNAELARLAGISAELERLGPGTTARAVQKATDEYDEAKKRIADLNNTTDEFAKRGAANIQDSLGQGLVNVLDGNFKTIGTNFGQLLKRMIAEAAAAKLSRAMFGDLVQGGEGSGLFGGLLRSFGGALGLTGGGGGYTSSQMTALDGLVNIVGARASGGPVNSGDTYLVGEKGPELFTPDVSGSIVPNDALGAQVSQSVVVSPTWQVAIDSRSDRGAIMADMQSLVTRGNQQMLEYLQRLRVVPAQ